jgi:hypothetical protein
MDFLINNYLTCVRERKEKKSEPRASESVRQPIKLQMLFLLYTNKVDAIYRASCGDKPYKDVINHGSTKNKKTKRVK